MAYLSAIKVGFAKKSTGPVSTGIHRGSSCPPGQVKIKDVTVFDRSAKRYVDRIECGTPRAPAPAPAPAPQAPPRINVQTHITPSFQQAFTPQFSPNLILSTGSGGVTAGTSQTAPGGQQARQSPASAPAQSGPSFSEIMQLMEAQRAAEREQRLSQESARRAELMREKDLEQQANIAREAEEKRRREEDRALREKEIATQRQQAEAQNRALLLQREQAEQARARAEQERATEQANFERVLSEQTASDGGVMAAPMPAPSPAQFAPGAPVIARKASEEPAPTTPQVEESGGMPELLIGGLILGAAAIVAYLNTEQG